jgi:cation-dependent mannose-6-phosphate receptor
MTVIIFSSLCSCLRLDRLKSRRGYTHLPNGQSGGRRGLVGAIGGRGPGNSSSRRPDLEEENRLIDQLDEEWED